MIAYSHRATKIITPAATILTANIAICNLMDYIITGIITEIINLSV
jgi:hypothetical protein